MLQLVTVNGRRVERPARGIPASPPVAVLVPVLPVAAWLLFAGLYWSAVLGPPPRRD